MISLSDLKPSARIKMNSGTGFLTLGTLTTILLLDNFALGRTIRTPTVRTGLDA